MNTSVMLLVASFVLSLTGLFVFIASMMLEFVGVLRSTQTHAMQVRL